MNNLIKDSSVYGLIACGKAYFMSMYDTAENLAVYFPMAKDRLLEVISIGLKELVAECKSTMPSEGVEKVLW